MMTVYRPRWAGGHDFEVIHHFTAPAWPAGAGPVSVSTSRGVTAPDGSSPPPAEVAALRRAGLTEVGDSVLRWAGGDDFGVIRFFSVAACDPPVRGR